MITKKYYKLIRVSYADEGYFCLTNVSNSIGNVKIDLKLSGGQYGCNYEYSTDGVTWNAYTVGNNVQVDPNSNIYWRYAGSGNNIGSYAPNGSPYGFFFDFDCYASGNLMSLYAKTDFANYTGNWCAYMCFKNQTHLLRADFNLGRNTTVGDYGMTNMFDGCTNLTTSPDLSSITSITGTQESSGGMREVFRNCTSLTSAPDLSNLTSIGKSGFSRAFDSCTSLTTAPDFTNLTSSGERGLYYAFNNCTSLTTGANLTNVTSVDSQGCLFMYSGCRALTTAYAPTITWDTGKMDNWLFNVAASGTLYADSSISSTIPTSSTSGCPNNWTVATI